MDDTASLAADLESASAALDTAASVTESAAPPADASGSTEPAATVPTETPAATSPSTETVPEPQGPIPLEVHRKALENARTKAVADFESQYGWAKQVTREQFQSVVDLVQRAKADPVGYVQDVIRELQNDPVHGPALRSAAARTLQAGRGQAAAPAPAPPMVDVQLEDGSVVSLPRNPAEWLAHHQKQWDAQIEQKLAPFTKTVQTLQQREADTAQKADADRFAGSLVGSLTKLPGFEEHKAAIATYIANAKMDSDHPAEVRAAALEAYAAIVVPHLQTQDRQSVLIDLNRKAGASTVNPAHASTTAPKSMKDMSITEALEFEAARMSAGGVR
jgi:hypothetical protein